MTLISLQAPATWSFVGPSVPGSLVPSGKPYRPGSDGRISASLQDLTALLALGFTYVSTFVSVSGGTYNLSSSDNGKILVFSSGSAVTLNVPVGLGAGFECGIIQYGAGQVTPTAASSVTINNRQSQTKTAGQYAMMSLIAVTADNFILAGDGA